MTSILPGVALVRIDVFTVFPQYLEPLHLSLVGKAIADGILQLRVHDLRDFTHDRHRTVDSTPFGGGPGMVMSPVPWGEALDSVVGSATPDASDVDPGLADTTLIVPTPAGRPLQQQVVADLAVKQRLLIACGRYEGIDQRVVEHYSTRLDVREISIGDYVLAGGEVAAMVLVEAVARLLPGVLGNSSSAAQDSFSESTDNLLEAPQYTKPRHWRGLDVPEVLLSGDHGRVAQWRQEQSVRRTRNVRPDLLAD